MEDPSAEVRETWGEAAAGWERQAARLREMGSAVAAWLVDAAEITDGNRVLDIAAGPGDTSILAARSVAPTGTVLCTDLAPEMVEVARRAVGREAVANIEFRELDAQAMDLPDDAFDAVICRMGYMLMPDPAAAFRETRRVLRPGGRLAFAAWAGPERNMWITLPGMVLMIRGHLPPTDPAAPGGVFSFADTERVASLLADAGFAEPRVAEIPYPFGAASFDDMWTFIGDVMGPLARVANALPPEERDEVRAELQQHLEQYRSGDGYAAPGVALGFATG